jgi:hypothetical protein
MGAARRISRCTQAGLFSGSRILYMSRPSTPAASLARLSPSLASRFGGRLERGAAIARGTQTTPSSSATITSPGVTSMPAQTTGMLTEPSVALIVPLLLMALLQTGKPISVQRLHVAHAGVDDQRARAARHEAGGQQVAEVAVGALGGDRRRRRCRRADLLGHHMHHPVVARVQQHGDGRARDLRAGVDGPHVGLQQADAAHGLVHRGAAEMRQLRRRMRGSARVMLR